MTVRFLADEDLRDSIIQGLRSREPTLDILDVKSAGLRGIKDPALLEIAAEQGRILITPTNRTRVPRIAQAANCNLGPSRIPVKERHGSM